MKEMLSIGESCNSIENNHLQVAGIYVEIATIDTELFSEDAAPSLEG